MNILLVFPELMDWFWDFKESLRFINKKATFPPLGILTAAALLPSNWNRRFLDLNVQKISDDDLAWADYVFISAMLVQHESVQNIISQCKQAGKKVVAGGPLFDSDWERYEGIDHFILNEAELTMPLFLADLQNGKAKRIYRTTEYPDITRSPVPSWDLLDMNQYDVIGIQSSRGCPNNCDFCNVTVLYGNRIRTKTTRQILAELDRLYDLGWRKNVYFVDDNFIGTKKRIKEEVLPAIINWRKGKKGMPFQTFATVNLADDEDLMRLMHEAGFNCVFVGIETTDEDTLTECNKPLNKNRNMLESVRRIQRAGMRVQGGFIVGFDNDTPAVFQQQIDFIQESGIPVAKVNQLHAFPGTRLYERMLQEGRIRKDITYNMDESEVTNIVPRMGLEAFQAGYKNLMSRIYSPRPYYTRLRVFLSDLKKPKVQSPLELQYILGFFRSIYHIGIKGVERRHYWPFLFWTIFRRPSLFPMAITLTIYGVHLRKVCERYELNS